jgi:hypothetical protein
VPESPEADNGRSAGVEAREPSPDLALSNLIDLTLDTALVNFLFRFSLSLSLAYLKRSSLKALSNTSCSAGVLPPAGEISLPLSIPGARSLGNSSSYYECMRIFRPSAVRFCGILFPSMSDETLLIPPLAAASVPPKTSSSLKRIALPLLCVDLTAQFLARTPPSSCSNFNICCWFSPFSLSCLPSSAY